MIYENTSSTQFSESPPTEASLTPEEELAVEVDPRRISSAPDLCKAGPRRD